MDRKKEQGELLMRLGYLLRPLQDMANNPENYDMDSRARIRASFFADVEKFEQEVLSFARGEPGYDYNTEFRRIQNLLNNFKYNLPINDNEVTSLKSNLESLSRRVISTIQSIPTVNSDKIFDPGSPFSCYCSLKDLCLSVKQKFILVDAYMSAELFHRYFREIPEGAEVTLVTRPEAKYKHNEWNEFLDISRLYAKERGNAAYRLITHSELHDRWLVCDNRMFSLGGSIKDAGAKAFTISPLDSTPENMSPIEEIIATGTEIFGAMQPNHP